jgi:olfactory receptor
MDNFLLTVMAYDRFVAICHPLYYIIIMNPRLCGLLVLMPWIIMFLVSLIHILLMKQLTFSTGTEIPHLFCELAHLLKLAGSDTLINNIVLYVVAAMIGVIPLTGIFFSYSQISLSLLRMSSIVSKYRAFSTCGFHLCVVCLFYGTGLGIYLGSSVTNSSKRSMITSMTYTIVIPMMSPFIYSLRNKEVKGAVERLLIRITSCPSWLSNLRTKVDVPTPTEKFMNIYIYIYMLYIYSIISGASCQIMMYHVLAPLPSMSILLYLTCKSSVHSLDNWSFSSL